MESDCTQTMYLAILKDELKPATGCTEPIAIAYCAAKLRETLGARPTEIMAEVSGNILKNVKSVIVPNTGGLKGLQAAIAVGIVAGDPHRELQVITQVAASEYPAIAAYLAETPMHVACPEEARMLDIRLTGKAGGDTAMVHIVDHHANIVQIVKNDTVLFENSMEDSTDGASPDKSHLTVAEILHFADTVDTALLAPLLDPQIACNSAIAEEGLRGDWGANIGSTLLADYGGDIKIEARAYAAAGSDARMSGCELPVVILSGSGNQGLTASLPVIRYAKHLGATQEQLYRALAVSALVTVHQKAGIGVLSAYCGAVSAGVGAGAGIAYLCGADVATISQTIVNAVAILSGTICDGAKPSCAAKIAEAVDAGILGYRMALHHDGFHGGDGILAEGVDSTITNVGVLAREGMRETDRTILKIMTE
ncbi:MAG: L-serine ammonia-lyase, iron-sulfur-dependent, subunit alpha [Oscillospiraceae bacterium]